MDTKTITSISFNQDKTCIAVGFRGGFTIFNVDPFAEMFHRTFTEDEIYHVEMLYRSNILGIITKGSDLSKPNTRLMIWDDHANRTIKDFNFKHSILAVRLSREMVVAVVESAIYLYDFRNFGLLQTIDTFENKLGLISMAPTTSKRILACLGTVPGQIRVLGGPSIAPSDRSPPTNKSMGSTLIQAHTSSVASFALNDEGSLIGTCSLKGTLVRVFNVESSQILHELRRGADQVLVYSIAFRKDSCYLACSSDKGTAHVYNLQSSKSGGENLSEHEATPTSQFDTSSVTLSAAVTSAASTGIAGLTSMVAGVKEVLPKFITAKRSFAQFRIPDWVGGRNVVGFTSDDSSIAVGLADGRFFRASYGGGGECAIIQTKRFTVEEN